MDKPRTLKELLDFVSADPVALEKFKLDPMPMLAGLSARERAPAHSDTFIYRFVVVVLGLVVIAIAGLEIGAHVQAVVTNSTVSPKMPDFLIFIGSTSLGALAGLLAPVPTSKGGHGG
jgi:hypothetical protein